MTLPIADSATPSASITSIHDQAPDRAAFSILVREHHRHLLAYACALLRDHSAAADLVQDALIIAFRNLTTFDTSGDFAAWVRGIIRNKWRELARQRKCETLSDEILDGIDSQHSAWLYAVAEAREKNPIFSKLDTCLQKLPALLREAVDTCYFQTRNSDEAAAVTGTNATTMRKRLERARTALRQCIESPEGLLTPEA